MGDSGLDNGLGDLDIDSIIASSAESAVSEPVDAAPAPETGSEPSQAASAETVETPASAEAQPAAPTEAQAPQPAPVNWDDESNPYLAQAREFERIRQAAQAVQARQAVEQTQKAITDLAEGDLDRQAQIHQLIDRIATPLQQQARQYEERATTGEKATAALWIAAQSLLDAGQVETLKTRMGQLMSVDGPDQMERLAFAERDAKKVYDAQLAEKDRQIADLRKQIGAQALLADRQARGADVVDAGRGASAAAPTTNLTTFDDWFNATVPDRR